MIFLTLDTQPMSHFDFNRVSYVKNTPLSDVNTMHPADIHDPRAGACVQIEGGHHAFVPGPIPTRIDLNAIWESLGDAEAALGGVRGLAAAARMPWLRMLTASAVRSEAAASSRIEGLQTRLPGLLRADLETEPNDHAGGDLHETRNYVATLNRGVEHIRGGQPLSGWLVRNLHAALLEGVRGQDITPGAFRTVQNLIGGSGETLATARYVPPPAHQVGPLLDDWETFSHQTGGMPDLVRCGILHQRFEAIHPFGDGNGRVGRLLIPLFLIARQRLDAPLLNLSEYFERNRRDYYEGLHAVHTDYAWEPWLRFFLTGVAHAGRKAVTQAHTLTDLRRRLRRELEGKHRARSLLDELFLNPYIHVKRAQQALGVARNTAQRTVDLLEERGVLKEVTGARRGRVWLAEDILAIIETSD